MTDAAVIEEVAMKRIRYLVLATLGVFAALPVAKVYTVGAPWIERMELRINDLVGLQGRGVPGTQIGVYYRQRNFRQGRVDIGGTPLDTFEWCGWLFGGNAIFLGSASVTAAGTWQLAGLDTQVLPGSAAGGTCDTGVLTQIELHSQYGNISVPELEYLTLDGLDYFTSPCPTDPARRRVAGAIRFANQVAAGLADGPNDAQTAAAPWTIDTDEDGADLCVNGIGCGARVSWEWCEVVMGTGTFQAPSTEVRDDSPLIGARDQEFNHVMGMIQGHKPGGSVLAVAYVPRPAPLGPVINVNVNMNGGGVGGCDAGGGYFDFVL